MEESNLFHKKLIKSKAEHKNKRVARRESTMNAVRSTMIYMRYRNNFQRNTM
jgi:hypothetical protein